METDITQPDMRGIEAPSNKIQENQLDYVRDHIKSFPTLEPHYNRKDSTKQYLDHNLNTKKMYELYVEYMNNKNKRDIIVKLHMYRRVFNTEFNLAFHQPRKEKCLKCEKHTQGQLTDIEYQSHMQNKVESRKHKTEDKTKAKTDSHFHAATFDLEQVLSTPSASTSTIYYKRKLSCYNLSLYSLGNRSGFCYLWDQTEGNRGSNEIGTCLNMYINSLPPSVTHITLYSDCCGGQNKNHILTSSLLYAMQENHNIKEINHKFLESGHTQMEVDSIHAAIECARKDTNVYHPKEWQLVCRVARRTKPYNVIPISHDHFLDFNEVITQVPFNLKQVKWQSTKWRHYLRTKENEVVLQQSEDFTSDLVPVVRKKTRQSKTDNDSSLTVKRAYKEKLPVSSSKKADLLALCKDGTIPEMYHSFYKSLSVAE